jgi:hypothetical protein
MPKQVGEGQAMLAFRAALAAVETVVKGEEADMGRYTVRYASLNAVHAEIRRALELHDLEVCQEPTIHEGLFAVFNTLLHSDGSLVEFAPMCLPMPKEAQALGSATTYLRRYSLVSQFGLAVEDDDGREATTAAQTQPGRRTEAERMIREAIGNMDDATRSAFQAAFKAQYGMGLADLPTRSHGDALAFARRWEHERAEAEQQAHDADTLERVDRENSEHNHGG